MLDLGQAVDPDTLGAERGVQRSSPFEIPESDGMLAVSGDDHRPASALGQDDRTDQDDISGVRLR
jgi:hypothetical protein